MCCLRYCKSTIFQANHNKNTLNSPISLLFAILQKYDFSSKSQRNFIYRIVRRSCLRYCKSTIFQANHNLYVCFWEFRIVVCDTAKVRFFKQITTLISVWSHLSRLFAILQKYDFSSKSQHYAEGSGYTGSCLRYCKSTIFQANHNETNAEFIGWYVVCDTAKVRFFKQITTRQGHCAPRLCCLRYCKSTIFQANHNLSSWVILPSTVVCDTAKVRFFKQITTVKFAGYLPCQLFAILQKYDFSSKSQPYSDIRCWVICCLRYCKSTIFQANHNARRVSCWNSAVVCDTAKVRFFKQITTRQETGINLLKLFAILQKYDFSSKSQPIFRHIALALRCLRYCKSTIFQANHN